MGATDPGRLADLAAVIMQEGLAQVCLVTSCMTITRAKIDVSIPRKRRGDCSQHEKGLNKFYDQVVQAILRHVNFDVAKAVLIASPGFVRQQFFDYMYQQAVKTRLADTKASEEVRALDSFYKMLKNEPAKAFYGPKHVALAVESEAVETLLICDKLFRARGVAERRKYVEMVDKVREVGGEVRVFSSLHVSGEQLEQLSGLCAILRFPMAELEDTDSDSDNE